MLKHHKLIFMLTGYLGILIWFRLQILVLFESENKWLVLGMLLIIPIILLIQIWRCNSAKNTEKLNPADSLKQLNDNQIFLLRKNMPTAQLDVLNDVLLVSLSLIHDFLSSVKVNSSNLFDDRLNALIELIKKINSNKTYTQVSISNLSRVNSIVIFAFYRVLYEGVMPLAINQKIVTEDIDPFILLKRIPPKMMRYLGAESWRVYEFKTLVFGDLNDLKLNADIKNDLIFLCTQEEKALLKPDQALSLHNEFCIERFMKHFNKWLSRKVRQYGINMGNYFFATAKNIEDNSLYISEIALSDFIKKENISLEEAKSQLESHMKSQSKYFLERKNESIMPVLWVKAHFTIEITKTLDGKIKEIKNESGSRI